MDYASASCEAEWLAAGRKLLHPLVPELVTGSVRATQPRLVATPPRQSGFNELLAVRYWVGPSKAF